MTNSDTTSDSPIPFAGSCPMTRQAVVDRYFMEHRGRLLEIAAFLDRIDRAQPGESNPSEADPRVTALLNAIEILSDRAPDRARRVQMILSDPSTEPIAEAHTQAACGAYVPTNARQSD